MATVAPISKEDFLKNAKPMTLTIEVDGQKQVLLGVAREFSSGSYGYYINGKPIIMVDNKPLQMQVGANITVIGSKPK